MKRIFTGLLAAILLLSSQAVFAATSEQPSAWARADFAQAAGAGIVPEELDAVYGQAITRAEFCQLIFRTVKAWGEMDLLGSQVTFEQGISFSDCDDEAVLFCAANGIVSGAGAGRFAPDESLERQAAAKMLKAAWELLQKESQGPLSPQNAVLPSDMPHVFADGAEIRAWAREGINWAYREGIAAGTGGNRFDPAGSYTREQAVVMVLKLYHLAVSPESVKKPQPDYYPFSDITYTGRIFSWYGSDLKQHSSEELGTVYPVGAAYGLGGSYGPVGTSRVAVVGQGNKRMLKDFYDTNGYFYSVTFFGDWVSLIQAEGGETYWGSAVVNLKTGQVLEGCSFFKDQTLSDSEICFVMGSDEKCTALTKNGALPGGYDQAGIFHNGCAAVRRGGSWMFMDRNGRKLSDIKLPKGVSVTEDPHKRLGPQLVLQKEGKEAFSNYGVLNREGFADGDITLCVKNDKTYIRRDSSFRSSLYSIGGVRLAGPFDRGFEEVERNLYRYLISDTVYQYFCLDSMSRVKPLFQVDSQLAGVTFASDGAGVYALAVSADSFVVFDCFGDTISRIQIPLPDYRIKNITSLEGIFGVWAGPVNPTGDYAAHEERELWFTPGGKQIPFPEIEPYQDFWGDDGSV